MDNACTQEEFGELMELIKNSPNPEAFDQAMKAFWDKSGEKDLPDGIEWSKMQRKIKLRLWALRRTKVKLAFATVILAVFCIGYLWKNRTAEVTAPVAYVTQHSLPGKTRVIVLADGSKITLNANSELTYPQVFNAKTREVYLKGEAYFEVAHKTHQPFIIHSGKIKTQVLGTTFTVSAYAADQPHNVTVLTGKVAVKDEDSKELVFLTRGQSATTEKGAAKFKLSALKTPEDAIAWLDDKLMFDNTDLKTVALKLGNKYGAHIVVSEHLAHQRITAVFQGQSLPGILNAITRLTRSGYKANDNTYTLY
ncbi:FecR family protein [Mucilaginibacter straminoryzae]|nr:FecR domain-containing protein [Mucilaginibacter straminoryzae]